MKLTKKLFSGCIALVMVVMVLSVVPSQKVYAASYPSVFMFEDSEFENLCVARTIECGSNTPLYFEWFREYNYEKYSIEIFDSNNKKVASVEGTPPVSSIGHITINWDTSDYKAGEYTVKVHKMFYSFYQWNETPNPSTYYITLTRTCTTHTWDTGTITKAATCTSEGTVQYKCTNCGETKDEVLQISEHTWDTGTITNSPTVFKKGVKTYTCTTCKKTKTKSLAKLKPTIKLSATKKTLKNKKSFKLTVSKLAKGDSIKKVQISNKNIVKTKKQGNTYTITAKKIGKATITVILKSGKKATCKITVK